MGVGVDLEAMTSNPCHPAEPEMVLIPSGDFIMGSDRAVDKEAQEVELPQHQLYLPEYAIGKTPVTSAQYSAFLRATRRGPPPYWKVWFWKRRWPPLGTNRHPVVFVTWYDAQAYCRWLSEITGKPYRLPNEPEWEKAARGSDGLIYPWGNKWNGAWCNIGARGRKQRVTPVDAFPEGASPYGVLDMIGNVWEWTRSLWGKSRRVPDYGHPYDREDGRENQAAPYYVRRVLRGVSFYNEPSFARCAARYRYSPRNRFDSVGFRVVISPHAPDPVQD